MKELKDIDLSCFSREQLERLVMVQLRTIEEYEVRWTLQDLAYNHVRFELR